MRAKRLLVVDDDPLFRQDMASILGRRFELHTAAGSEEALAMLQSKSYDLVILDLVLPRHLAIGAEPEGLALYRRLTMGASSPIVILATAEHELIPAVRKLLPERTPILSKPLTADDLRMITDKLADQGS